MTLKKYHAKRNFSKTPEPKGTTSKRAKNLYIIQKHAASHLHYDFRLELDGVLKSWAVPKGPSLDPSVKRLAVHVEDHPIEYGSFEGIIPKGQYGGGTVMLWDEGKWYPLEEDPEKAYKKGHLKFKLKGEKLKGLWKLIQLKNDPKNWLLIKGEDKYARPENKTEITDRKKLSVKTGRDLDEIAENKNVKVWQSKEVEDKLLKKQKKNLDEVISKLTRSTMPKKISPELATLVDDAPNGNDWLHEIKYDGYRFIAQIKKGQVKLLTRNGLDWTKKFPTIEKALKGLKIDNVILDGELVALDENGRSNFQLLQNTMQEHKPATLAYFIFDLLYYDHYLCTPLPLSERKQLLKSILDKCKAPLFYSDHVIGNGQVVFENACEMGLEGIISKKVDSAYGQRRTKDWLKVKCVKRQEFVIGGYTKPEGTRSKFGALLIGTYKNNKLIYCGRVGTGFTNESLDSVSKRLNELVIQENPFSTKPPGIKNVTWVKPVLLAEIEFTEWTQDGILRHPSFKGLRKDKPAKKVTIEKPKKLDEITHAKRKKNK